MLEQVACKETHAGPDLSRCQKFQTDGSEHNWEWSAHRHCMRTRLVLDHSDLCEHHNARAQCPKSKNAINNLKFKRRDIINFDKSSKWVVKWITGGSKKWFCKHYEASGCSRLSHMVETEIVKIFGLFEFLFFVRWFLR